MNSPRRRVKVLPSSIVPNFNTDGLVCRPIEGRFATRNLLAIRRKGSQPSATSLAFVELLKGVKLD